MVLETPLICQDSALGSRVPKYRGQRKGEAAVGRPLVRLVGFTEPEAYIRTVGLVAGAVGDYCLTFPANEPL